MLGACKITSVSGHNKYQNVLPHDEPAAVCLILQIRQGGNKVHVR
jgi:hypothetical protein